MSSDRFALGMPEDLMASLPAYFFEQQWLGKSKSFAERQTLRRAVSFRQQVRIYWHARTLALGGSSTLAADAGDVAMTPLLTA
jgi:hypothetical protein